MPESVSRHFSLISFSASQCHFLPPLSGWKYELQSNFLKMYFVRPFLWNILLCASNAGSSAKVYPHSCQEILDQKKKKMVRHSSYLWRCHVVLISFHFSHTLNKKIIEWPRQTMVVLLRRKFLVQWRYLHDFTATVFSWVNQEICMSSFQQGKYSGSRFRG